MKKHTIFFAVVAVFMYFYMEDWTKFERSVSSLLIAIFWALAELHQQIEETNRRLIKALAGTSDDR